MNDAYGVASVGESRVLARLDLDVSGWAVRLLGGGGYGPIVLMHTHNGTTVSDSVRRELVIATHRHRARQPGARARPGRTGRAWSLAYGHVGAEGEPRVVFVRHRRLWPARRVAAPAHRLGEAIWFAEAPGYFDEVLVSSSDEEVTRLL